MKETNAFSRDGSASGPNRSASGPEHIAIILDGNGRWAEARGLTRTAGHENGAGAVRLAVRACRERGVRVLTLYAFSVANWSRPKDEIDALMRICAEFAEGECDGLVKSNVKVVIIGDVDEVPSRTRRAMDRLVERTQDNDGMTLALALSYGGRRDVVNAMRAIAVRARAGLLIPEEIDEQSLRAFLTTNTLPDPDLVIRTGGERRLSDFLLFECAYSELFFTERFWPDFDEATLDEAIETYTRRRRRFGRLAAANAET